MQVTVAVKGHFITVDSPYTDDEAICILRGFISRRRVLSSFADDLLRKSEDGYRLSRKQLNWVHKIVYDAEERIGQQLPREITGQTRQDGSHRWAHPGT